MSTIKRIAFALAFTVLASFATALAQAPQVSTVNVTPDERKVRVSAVGDVLEMRVAVSDESGDIVFEGGPVVADKLDWTMRDAQGQRVPAGAYLMSVTYRTSSGKLKRRVEQVLVTEEVTGGASSAPEDPTPQAVANITGQGTTGRISKFTGANAVGNSAIFESGGRIGLGTTAPAQSLHVLGASSRLRLHSTGGSSLTATEYVNNVGRVWHAGVAGSTVAGVGSKFFVRDNNANQYRIVIDTAGNFGIGTLTPASRLTVNGGVQILGSGNGIKFPDGSIQTKATSGTINGTGAANRLAKFTGPNSFGNSSITEVSGNVGIGTAAPLTALEVRGSLTIEAGGSPELYTSVAGSEQNRYLQLVNSLSVRSASGLKAGGVLVSDNYGYAYPGKNDLIVKGSVGIGTTDPIARLGVVTQSGTGVRIRSGGSAAIEASNSASFGSGYINSAVLGSSTNIGVTGVSATGTGVLGVTTSGRAIYGAVSADGTGYAGLFDGKLRVNGTFENNSDRAAKANIASINPRSILRKLVAVPVQAWNYKSESASIRHLGPMAQDFRAAFGLGADDKTISAVDADGVALASVQALYQLMLEKDKQITQQNMRIERLEAQLNQVRRTIRRKRAAKR
jgi:hypothetical protein